MRNLRRLLRRGATRLIKRHPLLGILLAGESIDLPTLCTSILITGGIGKGKSVASELLLRQLIALGCPLLAACVKPDEARRYLRLAREAGASDRLRFFRPGGVLRINLLDYLCRMPGGGPVAAVQFLGRVQDILTRSEGGGQKDEAFWRTLFESALLAAIDLLLLTGTPVSFDNAYKVLASSPAHPKEAASQEFYDGPASSCCGRLLLKLNTLADQPHPAPDFRRRCERVTDVLVAELPAVGEKARGAVMAMNNGLLARFLVEPFYSLLCTQTTWTPEAAEAGGFLDVIDLPVLVHGTPARAFQFMIISLMQMHCLRRDPEAVALAQVIVRDEASYLLHPDWDASVQVVARSQKCLHLDIIQDFDVLQAALGGSARAKHEAFAFASNHMIKLIFGNANAETNAYCSQFFGSAREFTVSGGAGSAAPCGDFWDDLLGVDPSRFHWNEGAYEPRIRPEHFAALPVGHAVLYLAGRPLGPQGETFRLVNFWQGGR